MDVAWARLKNVRVRVGNRIRLRRSETVEKKYMCVY